MRKLFIRTDAQKLGLRNGRLVLLNAFDAIHTLTDKGARVCFERTEGR